MEEGRYHVVMASLARAWFLSAETQFQNNLRGRRTRERSPEYIVKKSRAGAGALTELRGSLKRERRS